MTSFVEPAHPPDRSSEDRSLRSRGPSSLARRRRVVTVAVVGNPNSGKTTLFNRLTGLHQKVGNYPGVTVERIEGRLHLDGVELRLIDLPGAYSLAAHSPDEMVTADVLLGRIAGEAPPDLVLQVVDASNLARNLYLFTQVREIGALVALVLNMTDVAARRGIRVDPSRLSRRLGVPVVSTQARRGEGIEGVRELLRSRSATLLAREPEAPPLSEGDPSALGASCLPASLREESAKIHRELHADARERLGHDLHPFEVLRALVDRGGWAERRLVSRLGAKAREEIDRARSALGAATPPASLEAAARYAWIRDRVDGCQEHTPATRGSWTDRIDRLLTHRILGLLIFCALMMLVFQSIFSWSAPVMDGIESLFDALGTQVGRILPEGTLRSLIVDGIIAGVGGVVIFLPQILVLFFFIGFLEDCGYMARAAFMMDKVMSRCGLSGKSFIPMLSGFACAVPGIMAARVIENRRDRIATILVTPLISCSARLPIYSILIGAFVPDRPIVAGVIGFRGVTLFSVYALGIVLAVVMASLFKRTILRGATPPFLLELPSYKLPSLGIVLYRVYDRGRAFLLRAGTVILAITMVVWALAYFPRPPEIAADYGLQRAELTRRIETGRDVDPATRERIERELADLAGRQEGEYLRQSFFARLGHGVAPLFRPLGWDWKISMAVLASFPAREVVVSTLATIYNISASQSDPDARLRDRLRRETWSGSGRPVFTVPVALSLLVFFALCCQCAATVATIRRETNSWGWAWFTFSYMTLLAYAAAFLTQRIGNLI